MRVALAAFVKTPGRSPIKTRLAARCGEEVAKNFYRVAVDAVEATMAATVPAGVAPYWAVAEHDAMDDPRWARFPRVSQGEGDLGERLATVYATLHARYGAVMLIGVDAPQLDTARIAEAVHWLSRPGRLVLGPATDGGFYLFGGSVAIPRERWLGIPYSTAETKVRLLDRIAGLGALLTLPSLTDVDEERDLAALADELAAAKGTSTPEREALVRWLARRGQTDRKAP